MHIKENSNVVNPESEEVSLKNLLLRIREWRRYFLSKWYIILTFSAIGAVLGVTYAFLKKPVYVATTSFVLEGGVSKNNLAAYAGIASSFGIDLGQAAGGLFEGDNILELYKSRTMIRKTLLTKANFNGISELLIDRYINGNNLREKWKADEEVRNIRFTASNIYENPRQQLLHDSIILVITKVIDKHFLDVEKKDKKLNIIQINVTSKDELFAKAFNEALVKNVNQFYLDTKTKKNLQNVAILQGKTDSVRSLMTGAINRAAAVADATPNQNPTQMAKRIAPIQNATANAEINKEVLGTLLENLELSKISLQKETPLLQIVDEPILPLDSKIVSKLIALVVGAIAGTLIILIILGAKKHFRNVLNS